MRGLPCSGLGNSATVEYDPYDLLVSSTKDAAENEISATSDYRVLQPVRVTDPNRNRAQVMFDALGMVAGTAVIMFPQETAPRPLLAASGALVVLTLVTCAGLLEAKRWARPIEAVRLVLVIGLAVGWRSLST